MPRFAANLSTLFTELPLAERFAAAARAGFRSVEIQFPYAMPAAEMRALLQQHRLQMVLMNLPAGDTAAGERGLACLPGRERDFDAGVEAGIAYARTLGVPRLHCLAGIAPAGSDETALRRTFVANVRRAAAAFKAAGLTLLLEPINRHDIPGYWLNRTDKAMALLDEIGADNALLQYDIYHAQRSEGELAQTIERLLPRIGHIQVADNPGRHEPGSGEINYAFVFAHLARLGWAGHIGCEYFPAGGTAAGLGWLAQARQAFADTAQARQASE